MPKSGQIIVTDKSCEAHGTAPYPHNQYRENEPGILAVRSAILLSGRRLSRQEQAQQPKKERPKSIKDIEGVGKATAGKLEEAGIKSVEALIEADAVELAKIIKISVKKIKNWQISCSNTVENC